MRHKWILAIMENTNNFINPLLKQEIKRCSLIHNIITKAAVPKAEGYPEQTEGCRFALWTRGNTGGGCAPLQPPKQTNQASPQAEEMPQRWGENKEK